MDEMLIRLALAVECPTCHAVIGDPCPSGLHPARVPAEHRVPEGSPRAARKKKPLLLSCASAHEGKRLYKSRHQAEAAASRIRKMGQRGPNGKPIRAYRCAVCGRWALTSRPQ